MGIYNQIQKDLARETRKWKHTGSDTVILQRVTRGPRDPSTPYIPGPETVVEYQLDALVAGVDERFVDGKTILATDYTVTTPPYGYVNGVQTPFTNPTVNDRITVNGASRQIHKAEATPPIGTPVNYTYYIAG